MVFLEAHDVVLGATARLAANGGGGSGADKYNNAAGDTSGESGRGDDQRANGGLGYQGGGNGGDGGDGATVGGDAGDSQSDVWAKGGGGGGGWIRINTFGGTHLQQTTGSVLSPNLGSCTSIGSAAWP
jgi:hypothetical protein